MQIDVFVSSHTVIGSKLFIIKNNCTSPNNFEQFLFNSAVLINFCSKIINNYLYFI